MKKTILIIGLILIGLLLLGCTSENDHIKELQKDSPPESFSFTPIIYNFNDSKDELRLLMLEMEFGDGWLTTSPVHTSQKFCFKDYNDPQDPDFNNCQEYAFIPIYCKTKTQTNQYDFYCSSTFKKINNESYNSTTNMTVQFHINSLKLSSGQITNSFVTTAIPREAIKIDYVTYDE
jgi:hypothetical protein